MSTENGIREAESPRFGLVDLVDAFTAFRHEYRTQVKESRQLHESLQLLSAKIEKLATQSISKSTSQNESDGSEVRRWVMMLIDFDIQWTRAIEATIRYEDTAQQESQRFPDVTQRIIASLTPWQRWWSAPLIHKLKSQPIAADLTKSGVTDGLMILLSRLRNLLGELGVERIDTMGQPFDGELMRSIGTMVDSNVTMGAVAQQLSSAYRWNGAVVKFADVRVSARV